MTKIRFLDPDPRVLPEMSAKVAFLAEALSPEQRKARTAVHGEAVVQADGSAAVFRVTDGVATRVAVKSMPSFSGIAHRRRPVACVVPARCTFCASAKSRTRSCGA